MYIFRNVSWINNIFSFVNPFVSLWVVAAPEQCLWSDWLKNYTEHIHVFLIVFHNNGTIEKDTHQAFGYVDIAVALTNKLLD